MTDDWFLGLVPFALCFILAVLIIVAIFFVFGWFVHVNLNLLQGNELYLL